MAVHPNIEIVIVVQLSFPKGVLPERGMQRLGSTAESLLQRRSMWHVCAHALSSRWCVIWSEIEIKTGRLQNKEILSIFQFWYAEQCSRIITIQWVIQWAPALIKNHCNYISTILTSKKKKSNCTWEALLASSGYAQVESHPKSNGK